MSDEQRVTRPGPTHSLFGTRCSALIAADPLDVLVIGGGIVGAGIARDAALRGLRTGLVEQYDFAAGTSSRSSRLLHGGLRYLAQGRFGLVREASREKHVLRRIAPHLALPLPFVFPTYRGASARASRASSWPLWQLRIGVKLYDWLCGAGNLGASSSLNRQQVLAALPRPNTAGLTGGVRYFDGLTNDARLVLDTLRSAAHAGACVCNYARFEGAEREGSIWRCRVRDGEGGRELRIAARCVVSATGPWANRLPQNKLPLRLTKGVHLVVSRARLPVSEAVVMPEGKRILFAIPWGERVILGTTDTDFRLADGKEDPLLDIRAEPRDVEYILGVVNGAFPEAHLNVGDVLSTWAGVRPLIAASRGGPSDVSRTHAIRMSADGWIEVGGGKLTTYRLMAEQAVTRLVSHLGRAVPACASARIPLLDAGETAFSVILPPEVSAKAVAHFCANEWARHLDDVMVRRTSWHHYRADPAPVAARVARWMAESLAWDEKTVQAELNRYHMAWRNMPASAAPESATGL